MTKALITEWHACRACSNAKPGHKHEPVFFGEVWLVCECGATITKTDYDESLRVSK